MRKKNHPGYAVVRVDKPASEGSAPTLWITVKEIVATPEEAEAEVQRLSRINAGKECLYFWQHTRILLSQPQSADERKA